MNRPIPQNTATVLRISTSGEIAGIAFTKAFAIAVMAVPLVGQSRVGVKRDGVRTISRPMNNGFAFASKMFRASMNQESVNSDDLSFA
jgi:hypothetical protein